MVQRLELRPPGSGRVRVTLPDEPKVSSVSAYAQFVGGSFARVFQTGPRGYSATANRDLVPATVRDRFIVQRREVVVASSGDGNVTTAAWLGPYHEAMTVFTGPAPSRATIMLLFEQFTFDDDVSGLRMIPSRPSGLGVASEGLTVVVLGRGFLSIPSPKDARALVPPHRGAPTRHGEVWRTPRVPDGEPNRAIDSNQPRDYMYILATAKGAAQIDLLPGSARDDQLFNWMDAIDVAWQ